MKRQRQRTTGRRSPGLAFPVGVIVVGVVLLLQTLGVLPWSLWAALWKFWPVLVILLGLSFVLRHAPAWVMPCITFLALAGVIAAAVAMEWPLKGPTTYRGSFAEPLNGAEKARVEVDFGAGKLFLASLPETSDSLVEGHFSGPSERVETTVTRHNGEATVKLSRASRTIVFGSLQEEWDVKLSRRVALDLDLDTGASDVELDMNDLQLLKLHLDAGAARVRVRFPQRAGATEASVKAGAAELTLEVPEGVAARISLKTVLGSANVDETRFPKKGAVYESPEFDQAENRLTLEVDSGAAKVTVR